MVQLQELAWREINTNSEIHNLLKRLKKDNYLVIKDGKLAQNIVKKPKIKELRDKDQLIIGYDRSKKVTLLFKKPKF